MKHGLKYGTMYGDFSRLPEGLFEPFTNVWMQQGRVQLDSDWNAQAALTRQRAAIGLTDIIGRTGAPAVSPGFGVRPMFGVELGLHGYLEVHDAAPFAFEGTQPFTLEAWVDLSPLDGGGTVLTCASPMADGGYSLFIRDTLVRFGRWELDERGEASWQLLEARRPLTPGRFMHVAAVYDGRVSRVYVGGKLAGEGAAGPGASGASQLFLGGVPEDSGVPGESLDGAMAGVRIWSRARSRAEIARDVARDRRGLADERAEHLIAHWPLDQGHGERAQNDVGARYATLRDGASWRLFDLAIEPGRYYVDGAIAELHRGERYTQQHAYPGARLPTHPGLYAIVLELWERSINPIEDPTLREIALGGPTTTTRSALVPAVRLISLPRAQADLLKLDHDETARRIESAVDSLTRSTARMSARLRPSGPVGNYLYRVEVHDPGVLGESLPSELIELEVVRVAAEVSELHLGDVDLEIVDFTIDEYVELTSGSGELRVHARVLHWHGERGALGIEIDVETLQILEADGPTTLRRSRGPTFKWSRTNGSTVEAIEPIEGDGKTLVVTGWTDGRMPISAGDWLEIVDDRYTLRNEPAHLVQVARVSSQQRRIELVEPAPSGVGRNGSLHPFVRRWDQHATEATQLRGGAVVIDRNQWIALEHGLSVSFEAGTYRRGDYWWVTARADSQSIEWPTRDDEPLSQPPLGVARSRAVLGLFAQGKGAAVVRDLRRVFATLPFHGGVPHGDTDGDGIEDEAIPLEPEVIPETRTEEPEPSPSFAEGGEIILRTVDEPPLNYHRTGDRIELEGPTPHWDHDALEGMGADCEGVTEVGGVAFVLSAEAIFRVADNGALAQGARMPALRRAFGLTACRGRIFVIGGVDDRGRRVDTVFAYDPSADQWETRAPLPRERSHLGATDVDGKIYAVGGIESFLWLFERASDRLDIYDPEHDRWSEGPTAPHRRSELGVATLGSQVHAVGGSRRSWGKDQETDTHQIYDVARKTWVEGEPLPLRVAAMAVAVHHGHLQVVGGRNRRGWLARANAYDPAFATWSAAPRLAIAVEFPHGAAVRSQPWVLGRAGAESSSVVRQRLAARPVLYVFARDEPDAVGRGDAASRLPPPVSRGMRPAGSDRAPEGHRRKPRARRALEIATAGTLTLGGGGGTAWWLLPNGESSGTGTEAGAEGGSAALEPVASIGRRQVHRVTSFGFVLFESGLTVAANGAPEAFHPDGAPGLDALTDAGRPGDWWALVTEGGGSRGTPIVQGEEDPAPGFYISSTALVDAERRQDDPRRYVDASQIPYVALPGGHDLFGAQLGDVATVLHLDSGMVAHAIVADEGPPDLLGTGSIALANSLELDADPRDGGASSGVVYLVYPGTGDGKPRSAEEIDEIGARELERLGGRAELERLAELHRGSTP
ncbi:MAG: DUF6519 domain-containing protein [Myxococcota bacterium]